MRSTPTSLRRSERSGGCAISAELFRRIGHRPHAADDVARRLETLDRGDGERAWLFDNGADDARPDLGAETVGFDMTAILDDPVRAHAGDDVPVPPRRGAARRVSRRSIVVDEGWKALDDMVFAARLRDWLKTLRKRNALVGFATQSARDALDSRIASAIVEQTATMIFTPNPRARAEDYCLGFGLSEHELELIRQLPAHSRCFLVRHANHSVVVRLDLSGQPDLLTVLSGREASVRRLDTLRDQRGDDPAGWYQALTGQPWPQDGDDLADFALADAAE